MRPPAGLDDWCAEHLGGRPDHLLWQTGHLSWVGALRLADGTEVVVKVREDNPRLAGCHQVHEIARRARFPCPQPLVGPQPLGGLIASAEQHLPGGVPGRWDDPNLADRTAAQLHRLVAVLPQPDALPTLQPPPPWTGWDDQRADPWPPPDEGPDLCADPAAAELRPLALTLTEMLRTARLPVVVGHADWYQGNLRWNGDRLLAADDWDSIAALPEAALAGCAAVSFRPGPPAAPDSPGADVTDTGRFLEFYAECRGRPFNPLEMRVAWAAGLWQRVFDAAKALVAGDVAAAAAQVRDADARRDLAGV